MYDKSHFHKKEWSVSVSVVELEVKQAKKGIWFQNVAPDLQFTLLAKNLLDNMTEKLFKTFEVLRGHYNQISANNAQTSAGGGHDSSPVAQR